MFESTRVTRQPGRLPRCDGHRLSPTLITRYRATVYQSIPQFLSCIIPIYTNTSPSFAAHTFVASLYQPTNLPHLKMGLPMDFNPPSPPSTNPTNTARLASWILRQSNQTKINVSYNDTTHFGENGAFPPRSIYLFTPIILRIESHNASNAHLLPGIRRPHFDIHPLVAKTLSELRAMLVEHVSSYPFLPPSSTLTHPLDPQPEQPKHDPQYGQPHQHYIECTIGDGATITNSKHQHQQ